MQKHAHLITSYSQFDLLKKHIKLIDHEQNDIYVHVDLKSTEFNFEDFSHLTSKSKLTFIDRKKVSWGGYSLLGCELALLKEAMKGNYFYYHINAGDSLPLKSQDEFHEFFEKNDGKEFLEIQEGAIAEKSVADRFRYYHFFQELIGKPKKESPLVLLNKISLKLQEAVGVDRFKRSRLELKKGLTWCSLTHKFVCEILAQEDELRKLYRYTFVPEEFCFQTIAWNSPFRERIENNSLRFMDWKKGGGPYTFREEDYDRLINSGCLWARKFNEKVDPVIIEKILTHVQN